MLHMQTHPRVCATRAQLRNHFSFPKIAELLRARFGLRCWLGTREPAVLQSTLILEGHGVTVCQNTVERRLDTPDLALGTACLRFRISGFPAQLCVGVSGQKGTDYVSSNLLPSCSMSLNTVMEGVMNLTAFS